MGHSSFSVLYFFLSDGTYLLLCDLITVFLNVINACVGVASPKKKKNPNELNRIIQVKKIHKKE